MKPIKGYYSLIQYCPDLSRLEAANVGVLLFCPEPQFIGARTTNSNQRIRRFFGSEDRDWEQIKALKTSIEHRLEAEAKSFRTLQDLDDFIATRANEIQITPPRPMKVLDPEQDLQLLFEELVGGTPRKESAAPVLGLLEQRINQEKLESYLLRGIRVSIPAFHQERSYPFAFQNGRLNLVQPASFSGTTASGAQLRACKLAVEGRSLFLHPDEIHGTLRLVVVGVVGPDQRIETAVVRDILKENEVHFYTEAELPLLVEEIRKTGKVQAT